MDKACPFCNKFKRNILGLNLMHYVNQEFRKYNWISFSLDNTGIASEEYCGLISSSLSMDDLLPYLPPDESRLIFFRFSPKEVVLFLWIPRASTVGNDNYMMWKDEGLQIPLIDYWQISEQDFGVKLSTQWYRHYPGRWFSNPDVLYQKIIDKMNILTCPMHFLAQAVDIALKLSKWNQFRQSEHYTIFWSKFQKLFSQPPQRHQLSESLRLCFLIDFVEGIEFLFKTHSIPFNPFQLCAALCHHQIPGCLQWLLQPIQAQTLSLKDLETETTCTDNIAWLGKDPIQSILGYLEEKDVLVFGSVSKYYRKLVWEMWDIPVDSEFHELGRIYGLDHKTKFLLHSSKQNWYNLTKNISVELMKEPVQNL